MRYSKLSSFVKPELVNGAAGAVVSPGGRLFAVMAFTVTNGKITRIDALLDPERRARLDLEIPRTRRETGATSPRCLTRRDRRRVILSTGCATRQNVRSDTSPVVRQRTFTEEARRAQIIGSAIEVLAELGYAQTSYARIGAGRH